MRVNSFVIYATVHGLYQLAIEMQIPFFRVLGLGSQDHVCWDTIDPFVGHTPLWMKP